MKFVARVLEGERVADLLDEYGISKKTAHKYLARYEEFGPAGLYDQSRAPRRIQHRTPPEVVQLLIATRTEHPTWGARKIKDVVQKANPGVRIPSHAAINYWLTQKGLIKTRPGRRRSPPATTVTSALTIPEQPNDVWGADFKGQFVLGNRSTCYPLTATDLTARFVLACEGLESTAADPAWLVFEEVFRRCGLPKVIRTDNGSPFASTGLAGLTKLSACWVRLGIRHERIEPGHPQQNGQHERMHRTLKAETTRPPGQNLLQQQERFDAFMDVFNNKRPHEALAMKTPSEVYTPSPREYRGLPELDYPLHDYTVDANHSGVIRLQSGVPVYLTRALGGERVGVREVEDGRWLVTFATIDLGYYDERQGGFEPT